MIANLPTDAEIAALIAEAKRMRARTLRDALDAVWRDVTEAFRIPHAYRDI